MISTKKNEVILDFSLVRQRRLALLMKLNAEDAGSRRCIFIQLPEPCEEKPEAFKAGYKTIAEIGKERLRRAATKIQKENPNYKGDLGFKVFKLDSSNIQAWNAEAIAAAQSDEEQAGLKKVRSI